MNNTTKKVCIFIPSLERGGVERNIINLSKGLVAEDIDVDILVSYADESFLSQVHTKVSIVKLDSRFILPGFGNIFPYRVRLAVSLIPAILKYFKNELPDTVISFQSSVSVVLARAISRFKPKLIIRESNTASCATAANKHWFSRIVPFLKKMCYPKADNIVAVSKGVANDLVKQIGIPKEHITVIYNPSFDDNVLEKAKVSLEHSWFNENQVPVVLGVGRLAFQKDFPTLLKAFRLIRQQVPSRLVILGDGPDRQKLEALAVELGIREDVDFAGFVDNPYKYLARCSVFVLSSVYEGLPNALIEALALRRPVVSTDCPSGAREILMDGSAGPLVAMGDYGAMADEVVKILQDREYADSFVTAAQKHLWRFRPEEAIKQYLQLLELNDVSSDAAVCS